MSAEKSRAGGRWLAQVSCGVSVLLLAALVSNNAPYVTVAGYAAIAVGGLCLAVLLPAVGRRALANTPAGVLDTLLSLAVVLALIWQGESLAYWVYGLAVGGELWARRFKFVLP